MVLFPCHGKLPMSFAFILQGKPAVNEIEKGQLYQQMTDLLGVAWRWGKTEIAPDVS